MKWKWTRAAVLALVLAGCAEDGGSQSPAIAPSDSEGTSEPSEDADAAEDPLDDSLAGPDGEAPDSGDGGPEADASQVDSSEDPDTSDPPRDDATDASEDGEASDARAPEPEPEPEVFDPGFRRLSEEQYNRTVADLHGAIWTQNCEKWDCPWPRTAADWYETVTEQNWGYWQEYQNAYPGDVHQGDPASPRGGFRRLDQVVFDEHIAAWTGAAMAIAQGSYEEWIGDDVVFEPCKNAFYAGEIDVASLDEVYPVCVEQFISEFGMLAFRRPLTADEHASFVEVFDATASAYPAEELTGKDLASRGLRNVIAVIMSSPEFLYRVELGDDAGQLTAYEVASRLSYHFWNSMPDEELFAAAADESLLTEEGYAAQVDRLFASPRTQPVIDEFYRDFFRVQDFVDLNTQDGPGSYHEWLGWNGWGGRHNGIREAMADEMANLGQWFTQEQPGTYEEMFRSNLHFLECQYPAWEPEQCGGAGPYSQWSYGFEGNCGQFDCSDHAGWDGTSPPSTLPQSERAGLLTRLGVLGHDTVMARPIRRGLYIREALLCETVPPPENCDVVKPPEIDIAMTVREKVEEITEQPDSTCIGCHGTLINGFGFALGHFSSMGQYWDTEHMFTDQTMANGEPWYILAEPADWAEIDAKGTTLFGGSMVTVDGAHELRDLLAESGQLEWCWSREYFRFAIGRLERAEDADSIDALAAQLQAGATLAEGFKAIALTPAFRSLEKPDPAPTDEEATEDAP